MELSLFCHDTTVYGRGFDVHQGFYPRRSGHDPSTKVSSGAFAPPHFLQPIRDKRHEHQARSTQADIFQRHQDKGELDLPVRLFAVCDGNDIRHQRLVSQKGQSENQCEQQQGF
jgi:hypothetical protein